MSRFIIASCITMKGKSSGESNLSTDPPVPKGDYEGTVVVLANVNNPAFMLFFPFKKEQAGMVNYLLEGHDGEYDANTEDLGLYKAMVDSWKAGDRYLSGVILDAVYDKDEKQDVPLVRLALIDRSGNLDDLVTVSFAHGILISAMEKAEIIVGESLLSKMVPFGSEGKDGPSDSNPRGFPEDKNIIQIVRDIMDAPVEENKDDQNLFGEDESPGKPKPEDGSTRAIRNCKTSKTRRTTKSNRTPRGKGKDKK